MTLAPQEALDLLQSDDLIGIGMAAHQMRKKKTDPRVVTYQIDRNINYTNFCTEYCSFCAFYRPMGAKDGYVLSIETILEKIEETIALGGTGILMQGGLNTDLHIDYYEGLLRAIKRALSAECICIAFRRRKSSALPKFPGFPCATRSCACATRVSIRFPAEARKSWTTKFARASPA